MSNPYDVDDTMIVRLHRALVEEDFVTDPEATVRQSIYAWNRAARESIDWPSQALSKRPDRREGWTLALDEFPLSFRDDLDQWIARLRGDDPLAEDAAPRRLRPSTVEHRAFQIRMFASALVRRNVPVERIDSLKALVEIENFKEAPKVHVGSQRRRADRSHLRLRHGHQGNRGSPREGDGTSTSMS